MKVFLPLQKPEHTILQYQDLLNQSDVTFRQMIQIIGCLLSTAVAVLPAPLHNRTLKCQQIFKSAEYQSFNPRVMLVFILVFSLGYPCLFQMPARNPILMSQSEYLLMGPKMEKYSVIEKRNFLEISGKSYLLKEFQKTLQSLSQVSEDEVQSFITNRLG